MKVNKQSRNKRRLKKNKLGISWQNKGSKNLNLLFMIYLKKSARAMENS